MALKLAKVLDTSGNYSIAGVVIDEDLKQTYSKDAVEYAIKLKAKYGNKYTDGYYLDYAKRHVLKEIVGAHREFHKNMKYSYEIQEKDWAGYSYEEIIEMENNGYKIPDNVLQWAHAQQQSDVTAYVMVSENAQSDTDTTEETTGDNSLDSIKSKATKYITQADQAQKETEQYIEQYKLASDRANEIKKKKEDSYEDSMKQILDLTNEWKELDKKNKSGTLSDSERKRYAELGKMLNGTDGTLTSEVQQDSAELDEFLSTLDTLNTKIDKNLEISQDAVQAGLELSKFVKNYNDKEEPYVNTGITVSGTGLLTDPLYGVTGDEVADLAIEKGKDLEEYSNTLSGELDSGAIADLAEFANAYSKLAAQTSNETKNAMGDSYEVSSEEYDDNQNKEAENNANQALQKQKGYSVSGTISYANSLDASVTTIQATADLVSQNKVTTGLEKELKKNLAKSTNDNNKLSSNVAAIEQNQQSITQQEETILGELESLQNEQDNKTSNSNQQITVVNFEDENNNSTEVEAKMEQLNEIEEQKNTENDALQKDVNQNVTSLSKTQKSVKDLDSQNTSLKKLSSNVQKVSTDTMFVGQGTMTLGVVDAALGTTMVSTGLTMMATPFTYNAGMVLTIAGKLLQQKAIKEEIFGAGAVVSGAAGLIASANSNTKSQNSDAVLKTAVEAVKENNNSIKGVQTSTGTEPVSNQATGNEETAGNTQAEATDQSGVQTQAEPININFTEEASDLTENQEQPVGDKQETQTAGATENQPTAAEEPKTEDNSQANQTSNETSENTQDATQNTDQKNNNQNDSVSVGFSFANALAATVTNTRSTNELQNIQANVAGVDGTVAEQIKKSQDIVKNIDKEAAKAENEKQTKDQQVQNITVQIEDTQTQMQSAETEEAVIASQAQMESLSSELAATGENGEQTSVQLDKTLANGVKELDAYKKSAQGLNDDISSFKNKISNQLQVSQDTMIVGIGTTALGITNTAMGTTLISSGLVMMSNPFTFQAGALQVGIGQAKLANGLLETATGTVATATAANGLSANNSAEKTLADAQGTLKTANNQYKNTDKDIQSTLTEGDETEEVSDDVTGTDSNQPTNIEIQANEDIQNTSEDTGILAASASANTNTAAQTASDDTTATVKLERFNNDSIIESKRKKKKVVAVSASSKGA